MATDDQDRRESDPGAGAGSSGAGRDDSGREAQPTSEESVEQHARTADRLERQGRSFDDDAGINPDRGQGATPAPDMSGGD